MDAPEWHWKHSLEIPLDTDERLEVEKILKEKEKTSE